MLCRSFKWKHQNEEKWGFLSRSLSRTEGQEREKKERTRRYHYRVFEWRWCCCHYRRRREPAEYVSKEFKELRNTVKGRGRGETLSSLPPLQRVSCVTFFSSSSASFLSFHLILPSFIFISYRIYFFFFLLAPSIHIGEKKKKKKTNARSRHRKELAQQLYRSKQSFTKEGENGKKSIRHTSNILFCTIPSVYSIQLFPILFPILRRYIERVSEREREVVKGNNRKRRKNFGGT